MLTQGNCAENLVLLAFEHSVGRQCVTLDPSSVNVVNRSSRRCKDCFTAVFFLDFLTCDSCEHRRRGYRRGIVSTMAPM